LRVFQKIVVTAVEAPIRFDVYYRKWYGRNRLVWPIILVLVVAGGENFVLAEALVKLDLSSTGLAVLPASIAGAYTFVTWGFFASVQRRSLLISDIMRGALRLAIAVPLGFALAGLSEGSGPFLAFSELSGVDSAAADRIADADITTVSQLAWCDPIDLTMRTNLRFAYVIDIVGQALSWVYLEKQLEKLRPFGLRGAFEIRSFMDEELKSTDATKAGSAKAVLATAATSIGITPEGLANAFDQIAYDAATDFLYAAG
jgi:hypothetical protein